MLCYTAVLKVLTYYQEQELCSVQLLYQICMDKSLHITILEKTVLLECIYEWYQSILDNN